MKLEHTIKYLTQEKMSLEKSLVFPYLNSSKKEFDLLRLKEISEELEYIKQHLAK